MPQALLHDTSEEDYVFRSAEDQRVWRSLVEEILSAATVDPTPYPTVYLPALKRLLARTHGVPQLASINLWLRTTGWQAECVPGYVPGDVYQSMLSHRAFPVARNIRRMRDLHHSAAPDFAHDLLGHLPMLFDERYGALLEAWASKALGAQPEAQDHAVAAAMDALIDAREQDHLDAAEIERRTARLVEAQRAASKACSRRFQLETFFTWALEFGVIGKKDGHQEIIGGACLSSPGEMRRMRTTAVQFRRFSDGAVGFPVDYTVYQPLMFVADSYDELSLRLMQI